MKKVVIWVSIVGFVFSVSAWAQPGYLIKISPVNQTVINQMRLTGIEIYAKTSNFWLGGVSKSDMEILRKTGTAFELLDQEAELGEFYLVWSRPHLRIEPRLYQIEDRCEVLFVEEYMALVKGNPRKIEPLNSNGFDLRKINRESLPLEPESFLPVIPQYSPLVYDPLIDTIIHRVDPAQLLSWVNDLSGEDTTTIGGDVDTIKTRYSLSPGIFKGANYLKERWEEMGLTVEFDTFQVDLTPPYFVDLACGSDGQNAWTVSYYGGIWKTVNGGYQWGMIPGTDALDLYDICRVNDDTLWAVGNYGVIVRSTDGGATWDDRSTPEYITMPFRRCFFEDAHTGWVTGYAVVLFTTDGGENWTEQVQRAGVRFFGIDFTDQNKGWVVGDSGIILHTTDRGDSWNPQNSGTAYRFRAVDFIDSLNGWAVGENGWAVYTSDGGTNWYRKTLSTSSSINNIDFVDELHGWMVAYDGSIFHTSDLGGSWTYQNSGSYYLYGVDFTDTLTGWAAGYGSIIQTTNGGQDWFPQSFGYESLQLLNVVGKIEGKTFPRREVLITGHYDATSEDPYNWTPGADDNVSGTVSLLASASILKNFDLSNTVKFVAFAGEEQGLLGSAAYAQNAYLRGDTILGVFNFDMIAWDGNGDDVLEVHCGEEQQNQALADIFIHTITDYGLDLTAQKITTGATDRSDHASFWAYNYPAILGIEDFDDFNAYYHTTSDRISVFDTAYYFDFTRGAVAATAILANPFILGDANKDRVVSVGDIVYLVNYLYKNGSQPDPLTSGDVTCDGTLNVGDVVFLVNYLFRSGPEPDC